MEAIQGYSSESSSDSEVDASQSSPKKRTPPDISVRPAKKLKPASEIEDLFEQKGRPEDDPALHGGRARSFAHVVGNFATSVYINVEISQDLQEVLDEVLESVREKAPGVKLELNKEFHMSLSRTVPVRRHQIEHMVESLKSEIRKISSFSVELKDFKFFYNDERTRSFVSVMASRGMNQMLKLVKCVDSSFKKFKQPKYYKNPEPHVSLAWAVGDISLDEELIGTDNSALVTVNCVCAKFGNQLYQLPLKNR